MAKADETVPVDPVEPGPAPSEAAPTTDGEALAPPPEPESDRGVTPAEGLIEPPAEALADAQSVALSTPDPEGLIGERACPLCDGHGVIPYGLKISSRYATCPECGGIGDVYTGSLNSEAATLQCENCQGKGYVAAALAVASGAAPSPTGNPPAPGMRWDPQSGAWTY